MARDPLWRCQCSREVGTIRWRNGQSVLKLARAVEHIMLGPGTASAICPGCESPVLFESREQTYCTTAISA